MVRVATRRGSTWPSPLQQRETARTILFRSTGSNEPLRLRTRIGEVTSGAMVGVGADVDGAVDMAPPSGPSGPGRVRRRGDALSRQARRPYAPSGAFWSHGAARAAPGRQVFGLP